MRTRSVLILLENLSLPSDRRAWRQATTLAAHGWRVTAVCPQGRDRDTAAYESIDGVDIFRYPLPITQPGLAGYVLEYSAMMIHSLRLTWRAFRRSPFAVIQGGNPPDLFFLIALLFRPLGVRYVHDERDANPELFEVKFGRSGVRRRILYQVVLWLEKLSLRTADEVIVPNESFRRIAVGRGHVSTARVTVVRGGPLQDELVPQGGSDWESDGFAHSIGYLGVMGSQDGVDVLLDAVAEIVARRGRTYVRLDLFGDGEQLESLRAQATRLGLDGIVLFHGFKPKEYFVPRLTAAELCAVPDPPNVFNDIITMNKVIECMALGRPIVAFDLSETAELVRDAGAIVKSASASAFAAEIERLLDDPQRLAAMSTAALRIFRAELGWERSVPSLLSVYDRVLEA